jgi:hypothetical protein
MRDINKPDIGLLSLSQVQLEAGLGVAYRFHRYFEPFADIVYSLETDNSKDFIEARGGIKSRLSGSFKDYSCSKPQKCLTRLTMSVPNLFRGLEMDYALVYPLGETGKSSLLSHYIGLTLFTTQIRYTDIDLLPVSLFITDIPQPDKPLTIKAVVKNKGKKASGGFSNTLYVLYKAGEYSTIFPTKFILNLNPAETETLVFNYTPKSEDPFFLVISVDDNGSSPTNTTGTVEEDKENNNRDSIVVLLKEALPVVDILPSVLISKVEKVELLYEEIPLLPLAFFEPGSDRMNDSEDLRAINEIARRHANNPDAVLVVRGYTDVSDLDAQGQELALKRATVVFRLHDSRLSPPYVNASELNHHHIITTKNRA